VSNMRRKYIGPASTHSSVPSWAGCFPATKIPRAAKTRRPTESLVVQIDGVNDADYSGVDGRVRPPHGGHGGKAFGGEQNALPKACTHRVQREDRFAAVRPVKIERLDNENFAPNVRLDLLRRDYVSDHAPNDHARECRTEARN